MRADPATGIQISLLFCFKIDAVCITCSAVESVVEFNNEPIPIKEKVAFCVFFAPFLCFFLAYLFKYVLRRSIKMERKTHQKSTFFVYSDRFLYIHRGTCLIKALI